MALNNPDEFFRLLDRERLDAIQRACTQCPEIEVFAVSDSDTHQILSFSVSDGRAVFCGNGITLRQAIDNAMKPADS